MERAMNENKIYRAAIYCRLSKDDEQIGESVSIETQKMLLTDYCVERGWLIHDTYVDDGYSGANFRRPAFEKMLEDARNGRIDVVIVKDLSRLGRDYIGTGEYMEKIFPRLGVRFIAIADGYEMLLTDYARYLSGKKPRFFVNPEVGYGK